MLPAVAEIILVDDFLFWLRKNFLEPRPSFILELKLRELVDARDPVILFTDNELMQMRIVPTHRHLNDPVELGECSVAWDLYPPPDRRANVLQSNLELIGRHRFGFFHESSSAFPLNFKTTQEVRLFPHALRHR